MVTLLGNEVFADDKGSRGVSPRIPQVAPKRTDVRRPETAEEQTHTKRRAVATAARGSQRARCPGATLISDGE